VLALYKEPVSVTGIYGIPHGQLTAMAVGSCVVFYILSLFLISLQGSSILVRTGGMYSYLCHFLLKCG